MCVCVCVCVRQQFIGRASDEIQSLFSLHVGTSDEFHDVLQYFGESPRDTTSSDWFTDHTQPGRPFWMNKLSLAVPVGHSATGSLTTLSLAVPSE